MVDKQEAGPYAHEHGLKKRPGATAFAQRATAGRVAGGGTGTRHASAPAG
jgi:hypothetical protein